MLFPDFSKQEDELMGVLQTKELAVVSRMVVNGGGMSLRETK